MLEVPSGRILNELDINIIRLFHEHGTIVWRDEPFRLKSKVESHVYVNGRDDFTDNPKLLWLIGRKGALLIQEQRQVFTKQTCLIGIPTAGTALAAAISMVSFKEEIYVGGKSICYRIMRETQKGHGAHQKWVNGEPDSSKHLYWDSDNVVTDGASKFEAREKIEEDGYPVDHMPSFILVDRQQGGIENMQRKGIKQIAIAYYLLDITFAFAELELWPREAVDAVREEIEAHQLL